ncbi:uncharacterized protein LOC135226688 [Macrobrachium nipponense]|uniref:uncharacterized protein LOC135226688 n=1 Tax=Macrobrachium nipponense TaxID=159736 RepID=UPI0030C848F0
MPDPSRYQHPLHNQYSPEKAPHHAPGTPGAGTPKHPSTHQCSPGDKDTPPCPTPALPGTRHKLYSPGDKTPPTMLTPADASTSTTSICSRGTRHPPPCPDPRAGRQHPSTLIILQGQDTHHPDPKQDQPTPQPMFSGDPKGHPPLLTPAMLAPTPTQQYFSGGTKDFPPWGPGPKQTPSKPLPLYSLQTQDTHHARTPAPPPGQTPPEYSPGTSTHHALTPADASTLHY